jgi:RNA polymerase sigma-70 factor (ECF subfamily)
MAIERADDQDFRRVVEAYERGLRVHCYRLLGSLQDAEDLTQETLLKAWRSLDSFSGRAPLRTWLYRIATNACLDEIERRARRLLPVMVGAPRRSFVAGQSAPAETPWLEPLPDAWLEVADSAPGPEARYETRESIELAFVATLQLLPPRQRAVLLMRDVLGWSTQEVADLLDLTVTATHSLLQRARTTLSQQATPASSRLSPEAEQRLVSRYVRAWEHADIEELLSLLRQDARLSMPPLPEWYAGIEAIAAFLRWVLGPDGLGPYRLVPTRANGVPAFGIYARGSASILQVVEADQSGIRSLTSFMNPGLFRFFDLPD